MILLFAALLPALAGGPSDAQGAVKLATPGVEYRMDEASATRSPWIDANGWRIVRQPDARFYYDVPAKAAGLSAAEAFAYGAHASVHTTGDGIDAFHRMLSFLRGVPDVNLPAAANVGVIDDGSDESGELMNLLSRHNLLYKIVRAPDPRLNVTVKLGAGRYSKDEDPTILSHKIRSEVGDAKRLLRIYGSEVVIARLMSDATRARIHVLNYANRTVAGLRVRVIGKYSQAGVAAFDKPGLKLADFETRESATEFTIPEMSTYVVIDLTRAR